MLRTPGLLTCRTNPLGFSSTTPVSMYGWATLEAIGTVWGTTHSPRTPRNFGRSLLMSLRNMTCPLSSTSLPRSLMSPRLGMWDTHKARSWDSSVSATRLWHLRFLCLLPFLRLPTLVMSMCRCFMLWQGSTWWSCFCFWEKSRSCQALPLSPSSCRITASLHLRSARMACVSSWDATRTTGMQLGSTCTPVTTRQAPPSPTWLIFLRL
mmetsp:Transcript_26034/g.60013  ORF Transcript_26034/g.60013 Transcript_26034/m.60013 type:complete len:209 (-) Transcript_26034:571-1197(-)